MAASPPFLLGDARKWHLSHQSPVIPLISGEWIVSHAWYEILRLSPYLFWLGLFTHRAFSSAQDDDTRGRKGSHLGDTLRVLGTSGVILRYEYPLGEGARQRRRMDSRSGVKDYVRLSVSLKRHPDRSGGIFLADR